jgi:tetratricopeptide (TPR) repeat protein
MKNRILAFSLIPLAAMTMSACDIQRISTPNPTHIILFTAVPTPTLSSQDYYYNGELFYTQGDYELAIRAYDAALRLDPDFAYVYFRRGQAYANIENFYLPSNSTRNTPLPITSAALSTS